MPTASQMFLEDHWCKESVENNNQASITTSKNTIKCQKFIVHEDLNEDKNLVNSTSHVPRTAVPSVPDNIVGGSGLQVSTRKQKMRSISTQQLTIFTIYFTFQFDTI